MGKGKARAPKKRTPLYTYLPTGEHYELVKTTPVTLVPLRGRRAFGDARRPTKITFARDYKIVTEL